MSQIKAKDIAAIEGHVRAAAQAVLDALRLVKDIRYGRK